MIRIVLSPEQVKLLMRPVAGRGGMQSLLRDLQKRIGKEGALLLNKKDVIRIRSYVDSYGQGGFQDRLKPIIELADHARELDHQSTLDED